MNCLRHFLGCPAPPPPPTHTHTQKKKDKKKNTLGNLHEFGLSLQRQSKPSLGEVIVSTFCQTLNQYCLIHALQPRILQI